MNRAAQQLGRLAKGHKKTLTKKERLRRSMVMKALNKGRRGRRKT